ncbi:MAG: ferredoxin family protein [Prevotella sp.]|nr:ferredoxin family protein [Prevotella sp.]
MIFYLSCTGNTKWAACVLQNKLNDTLVNMAEATEESLSYSLKEGERIGFCFPVHGWRPPLLVRRFIQRLHIEDAKRHFCYAVCTAGDNIGETISILKNDLTARGVRLDSAFSLIMPESYVGLPFMDVDTPEKETQKKTKAAADLQHFAKYIVNRERGIEKLVEGRWKRTNSRLIGHIFVKCLITDKPFHVTTGKCVKCGKCVAACPVHNMELNADGYPIWRHDGSCLSCFACYHHCPNHAIEYGNRTKNKGQYCFAK